MEGRLSDQMATKDDSAALRTEIIEVTQSVTALTNHIDIERKVLPWRGFHVLSKKIAYVVDILITLILECKEPEHQLLIIQCSHALVGDVRESTPEIGISRQIRDYVDKRAVQHSYRTVPQLLVDRLELV